MLRIDNAAEYTNSMFVDYCNGLRTDPELKAPYTPQQNGPMKSRLSRVIKAGHATRFEIKKLFPDIRLETEASARSGWLKLVEWSLFCGHPRG